ncbi:hypothetical protein C8Q75DRAFT_341495 [Abortiporus biennis]|nr:hypothetical protein C8Q75DRAFT_341495 [Abortiporus biennis]
MFDSEGHEAYDPCGIHLLPSLDDKLSYPFLTTLAINFRRTSNWPTYAWKSLKFPKLKVVDLQNIGSCDPKIIYDFIQRHSTLLEVNVSFEEAELRFEGLIKLINGTGTWIARKKSIAVGGNKYRYTSTDSIAALDEPCLVYRQVPGKLKMKCRPLPDDLPNSYIIFDAFAFTRVPISPTSTQWKSHKGSQNPRYEATKLALHIHDQYRWEKKFYKVAYIHDFLLYHELCPKLEELRLSSETWLESDKYFDLYMREIGFRLANWKHLRKLSLSFVIPDNEWMWSYRDPELDLDPPAGYSSNYVRFIDDIVPPIEYWQGDSRLYTLKTTIPWIGMIGIC